MHDSEKFTFMQAIASVLACAGMGYLQICAEALKSITAIFSRHDLWKLGVQVDHAMKRLASMSEDEQTQATETARATGKRLSLLKPEPPAAD
jgi:hypothetical protein